MIDDETLMAYADGELDAAAREAVARAIAADASLAERVRRHQALSGRVGSAFGAVLGEPVPQALLDALRESIASAPAADVVDLAAARAARGVDRVAPRRWLRAEWGAMAACLVLGVAVGYFAGPAFESGPFDTSSGQLIARGELERSLSKQPAGAVDTDGKVAIQLSFVAADGTYCRSFALREPDALAGFACRDASQWRVQLLAQLHDAAAAGGYRPAGSALPAALARAIEERMQGPPLDAQAEQQAIARGWQR